MNSTDILTYINLGLIVVFIILAYLHLDSYKRNTKIMFTRISAVEKALVTLQENKIVQIIKQKTQGITVEHSDDRSNS